jgi:hypothetical protein
MKWTRLFLAQLRQSLRTPWTFFFVVLAIAAALAAGLSQSDPPSDRFLVAVVNEDEGLHGDRLIAGLAEIERLDLRPMEKGAALAKLRQDRLEAVFVIRRDYSEKLRRNEYRDLIDWYSAPSSRAAATISEPLINGTMRFLVEEQSIRSTREFLTNKGIAYSPDDEQAQREKIQRVWANEALVHIAAESLRAEGSSPSNPAKPADSAGGDPFLGKYGALAACVRWYAVFCVFYLVVSASWILDINKRSLRVRVTQSGTHLWQLLLGTSLAPLLIGLGGYWLTGCLCCLQSGGWLEMLYLSLPVSIYLWTVLGLTITIASFLRQALALLFLAPLVTFIHAILGGLITALPEWASLLVYLSRALPGRWLLLALSSPLAALLPSMLCCFGWFLAGVLISEIRRLHVDRSGATA